MKTKICPRCKTEKPLIEFRWKNKKKEIRDSHCISCAREFGKAHYRNNTQKIKTQVKNRNKSYALKNQEWKSNLFCVSCGENETSCLDFHHLDPNTKENIISEMLRNNSLAAVMREAEKCVVVCANCHRKIHAGVLLLSIKDVQKSKRILIESRALVA